MTMVYGVLGRENISLTRGQTTICLYGRDWLKANLDHWLWGIQRGSAAEAGQFSPHLAKIPNGPVIAKLLLSRMSGDTFAQWLMGA